MLKKLYKMPMSADEVYKDILDKILTLKYEPGKKISENELCEEYNVSRSVIRTAFTRLKEQKLLEIYPQRGTYVSLIDVTFSSNTLYVRAALEKEVLSDVMKLDNEKKNNLIIALEDNLNKQLKHYNNKTYTKEFMILDEKFHNLLMESVNRSGLFGLMTESLIHVSRWRNFYVNFTHRIPELVDQHKELIETIRDNDLIKAQELMDKHIKSILNMRLKIYETYPEYFKY